MTTLSCPMCGRPTHDTLCAHTLGYISNTRYQIRYTPDNKTEVVSWIHVGIALKGDLLLTLNGYVELTMERINKLLLLK